MLWVAPIIELFIAVVSSWWRFFGLQVLLATSGSRRVPSFVLFLDNLYGRLSDVAFLKITYIGFYKRTSAVAEKATSLSLTPSLRHTSSRVVFLWKAISS